MEGEGWGEAVLVRGLKSLPSFVFVEVKLAVVFVVVLELPGVWSLVEFSSCACICGILSV